MDDTQKYKLIDSASQKYKKIYQSGHKKFKYLPEWLRAKANYYNSDIKHSRKNNKVFQRGALIMVDFGINIGNELSGNHFAVVLNKSDSPKNGVLTVVPVSSKVNKFAIEIDGLISEKSARVLRLDVIEQDITIRFLGKRIVKDNLTDDEKKEMVTEVYENGGSATYTKYISRQSFLKILNEKEQIMSKITHVINFYEKYNKISYAKCLDITTISKKRVFFLNEYDPCGKIKVSNETLDKIDETIKEWFINS